MVLFLLFYVAFVFKLEYNCFTMLCQFLLYNNVNQLYVYTYSLPLQPPSHSPIPPIQVITEHRAELPVLYCSFPLAIYFTHGSVFISIHPPFHPPLFLQSVLYVCASIPALKIGSLVPFFHVCVRSVAQSCLTLCDPMYCTHQTPLSMEFSRQESQSGLPFPPPGDFPDPGIKPMSRFYICAVLCLISQSCLTLCDPMDCSQAPLSMVILHARILKWIAMSSSRGSSQSRNRIGVSCIAGGFFTS